MVNANGMTKEMFASLSFSEDEKVALAEARGQLFLMKIVRKQLLKGL